MCTIAQYGSVSIILIANRGQSATPRGCWLIPQRRRWVGGIQCFNSSWFLSRSGCLAMIGRRPRCVWWPALHVHLFVVVPHVTFRRGLFVATQQLRTDNRVSPRERRDDIPPPPPVAVRRWQKSRRIYVRLRTGPQSTHLWWPAVAKLQAASAPIA